VRHEVTVPPALLEELREVIGQVKMAVARARDPLDGLGLPPWVRRDLDLVAARSHTTAAIVVKDVLTRAMWTLRRDGQLPHRARGKGR
jgi:hypothetical protein